MGKYKNADEKMKSGWENISAGEAVRGCDEWLSAWEDIKDIMEEENCTSIAELQKKYEWSDFLTNFVQDLEMELGNAGIEDKEYYQKRIEYCSEMLNICGITDELTIENTRRAIADSHFALGNVEECDRLYRKWLDEDPDWGWGYIGWSDNYHQLSKTDIETQSEKAEKILTEALSHKTLRDRLDVLERAKEFYEETGDPEKSAEIKKELSRISVLEKKSNHSPKQTPVKMEKTGRNAPCPCGSGKKYKKCCGDN